MPEIVFLFKHKKNSKGFMLAGLYGNTIFKYKNKN